MTVVTDVNVSRVIWNKRVFGLREENVRDLMASIKKSGLIQPVVMDEVEKEDSPSDFRIIVGRHRYEAIKRLYKFETNFILTFLGRKVPWGTIPTVLVHDLDAATLLELEITENVVRMDLTWQQRAEALALFTQHEERQAAAAGKPAPTMTVIAKKLAGASGGSEDSIRNRISQSIIIAKHLEDKDISTADSAKAAFNRIRSKTTAQLRALTVDETRADTTPHKLMFGDCRELMPLLPADSMDLIFGDPPYGVNAHMWDNMKQHKYLDTWQNAMEIYASICAQGFRIAKPSANLWLFCTPERWWDVKEIAEICGWVVWPRPLIWIKSNEGMRPHGQQGFAYTYEGMLQATKGGKGLVETNNDIFNYYRPKASEREHAAAKPVELLSRIFQITCLPGDSILDCCVGSGTSYRAAFQTKMSVTGIENDEETYKTAERNMFPQEMASLPESIRTVQLETPPALALDEV